MKNLLLALMLLLPSFTFGQVNIESVRNTQKEKMFWGEIKGGLELQKGNVDVLAYDLDVLTHFQKKSHHVFLQGKTSQGKQEDKKFKNASFAHLRWTWMCFEIIGVELFTQIQQDEFKSLEVRQLNGGGLRSELIKNKNLTLSLGSGAMLDYEIIKDKESSMLLRSTSYLTFLKTFENNKKSMFMFTVYYQPLFDDFSDYRINLEGNIQTVLIDSWNIFIDNSINFMYDTKPPEGILTNDLIIKTSLLYSW